jgi:hypothetical protein
MTLLITILLILLLLGAVPVWPHSSAYGYSPVVIITILLIVFLLFGGNLH